MARKSVKGVVRVVYAKKDKTQIKMRKRDGNDSPYFDLMLTNNNYDAIVATALLAVSTKLNAQIFYNDSNNQVTDLAVS